MLSLNLIKGIGPRYLKCLNTLNINSVNDLLEHYPYKYNFLSVKNIKEIQEDENVFLEGLVDSQPILRRFNRKMNSLNFRMNINNKVISVVIFNRGFLKEKIVPGKFLTIYGKYDKLKNNFVASDIKFIKIEGEEYDPMYHLTNGLNQGIMKKFINEAIEYKDEIKSLLPEYIEDKYNFINKNESIQKIHQPKSKGDIKKAKLRLIYEELFLFMFKINYFKYINKKRTRKLKKFDKEKVEQFISTLPYLLTKDQKKVIKKIESEFNEGSVINRLIQGDVGSGKTIVAVVAGYMNILAGYQTALMAPTEILAYQHYETIKNLFLDTDVNVSCVTGSMKASEKKKIHEDLKSGKIDFIIGTHALISEKVEYKNLGLVITDEQHRFGVNQRSNLRNKGIKTDILYLSATPIPRTFALTIYGDMDISNIQEKPEGRKEIETIIKEETEIKEILELMTEEIKKGRQIYVVSPLIEDSEILDLTNVNKLKEKLDLAFNNKVKTEILHGKLNADDKTKVMNNFIENKTQILISTTVIEVGVDVKNATMIVVFDAERFGLSTLHQLRGRIGRNEYESKCILIGNENNKRLKVLKTSNDGFYITERDFELRGEGDLFGVKQSGDMSFKIANLQRDFKILLQAKEDSNKFLKDNIDDNFKNYKEYSKIVEEIVNVD